MRTPASAMVSVGGRGAVGAVRTKTSRRDRLEGLTPSEVSSDEIFALAFSTGVGIQRSGDSSRDRKIVR